MADLDWLEGQAVEEAKREISRDIEDGRVPPDVKDFAALHQYVDANVYGGDWLGRIFAEQPQRVAVRAVKAVEAEVSRWLQEGRPMRKPTIKEQYDAALMDLVEFGWAIVPSYIFAMNLVRLSYFRGVPARVAYRLGDSWKVELL